VLGGVPQHLPGITLAGVDLEKQQIMAARVSDHSHPFGRKHPLVHPQVERLLEEWKARQSVGPPMWTAASVRAEDDEVLDLQRQPVSLHEISDRELPGTGGVVARFYEPLRDVRETIIYYHGGGFVIGARGYDRPLRELALTTGARIVGPNVRLAPEHQFPIPLDDALATARELIRQCRDTARIGIAGDSSGGNLAAVVARELTREGVRIDFLVLIYPMLDATASSPSYREFADGFGFSRAKALWYFSQYLPHEVDRRDSRVSPIFANDLDGMPPTLVITAECDPLRDEGEQFACRLDRLGVRAELRRFDGMIHGFFQMTAVIDAASEAQQEIARWLAPA
jgi:acetyl esterase